MAEWWRSFIAGPNSAAMRWPLRRFGVAQQRSFAEDRLVDLAIALEAIFMREDDPQRGTGSQIARKANEFLGGGPPERKVRTRQMLAAYRARSDIVHGRLPPEDEVKQAASSLEKVLGETLRGLLAATSQMDLTAPPPKRQNRS
jgi:hypothetical protein